MNKPEGSSRFRSSLTRLDWTTTAMSSEAVCYINTAVG